MATWGIIPSRTVGCGYIEEHQTKDLVMLLAGLASFLQITLLPGLLAVRMMGVGTGVIRTITTSFALSLILNYHLVLLLTYIGVYSRSVLFPIFAAEVLWVTFAFRKVFLCRIGDVVHVIESRWKYVAEKVKQGKENLNLSGELVAVSVVLLFFFKFLFSFGQIFDGWDDVVSWNRWAVDWYNGRFPTLTWHYPQLLPANWSITYAFMNDGRIQFFAKAISALFPLLSILTMYDLWLRKDARSYLYAIPSLGLIFVLFAGNYLSKGYADIPVAFMSLMAVYHLIRLGENERATEKLKAVYVGTLCCAGAGLTKQAGLYFAGIYPVLSYLTTTRKLDGRKQVNKLFITVSQYAILATVLAPWYFSKEVAIHAGADNSEISYVTSGVYGTQNLTDHALDAIDILITEACSNISSLAGVEGISEIRIVVILLLLALVYALCCSLKGPLCRYVMSLIVVPYFVIWCLFFSYDVRNLTLIFPYLALCAGNAIEWNFSFLGGGRYQDAKKPAEEATTSLNLVERCHYKANLWVAVISLSVVLIGLALYFDDEYLIRRQLYLQREIHEPSVNRMLYDSVGNSSEGRIITDYQIMKYLPGFESRCAVVDMTDENDFFAAIAKQNANYIFFGRGNGSDRVLNYIVHELNAGRYKFINEVQGYVLVKVS